MTLQEFKNRPGVWFVYLAEVGTINVLYVTDDSVQAIVKAANEPTARLGFWPFGLGVFEAVAWWETDGKALIV